MVGITRELEAKPNREGFVQIEQFGTRFGIEYVEKLTGRREKVPITVSPEEGVFYAVFPEDNVDFEVVVNNEGNLKLDLGYGIELHKEISHFSQRKNSKARMPTLKTLGRKLHFMKQTGEEGQVIVAMAALKHGLGYEEASIMVSRMNFKSVYYGTQIKHDEMRMAEKTMIQVFVKTLRGNTIKLDVSHIEKIEDVKKMIEDREGFPAADQRLMFTKFLLADGHMLACYEIKDGANLVMYGESVKGGRPLKSSRKSLPSKSRAGRNTAEPTGIAVGDRGVICLGEKSNCVFGLIDHFILDRSTRVKPFVIEMRIASRFGMF